MLGRFGLALLWITGLALTLAALVVAGLAALVAHGPVEVATAARSAQTLLGEIAGPGGKAEVGNARLDWSWDKGLLVDLGDISVDRAGILSMHVPRAEIRLRMLPLLSGEVRPSSLVLIDPHLTIDTGAMAAAQSEAGAAAPETAMLETSAAAVSSTVAMPTKPGAATALVGVPPAHPLRSIAEAREIGRAVERTVTKARAEGIEHFVIRNATIDLMRATVGGVDRSVRIPEIESEAVVDGPAGELDVGFSARGEIGRWSMRLTALREADGGRRLVFVADDVTRRDLFGPPGPAFDIGMPLYPRLSLRFDGEDRFDGASVDLRLGAGEFRFGPMPEDSILVDEGQMQIGWKSERSEFEVRNLYLAVGETNMTLHGRIVPDATGKGPWDVQLVADSGNFRPRDVPGSPLVVDGGRLDARFDPATKLLDIAQATATFGKGWVKAAGRLDFSGAEPRMRLDIGFSPLDVVEVKRVWPHWVAPETRDWFIPNVEGGRLVDAAIRLDMPRFDHPETWPAGAFRMNARFEGARFRVFGNLPPIAAAEGRLTIAERKLDLLVERGQVATRASRKPTLETLRFQVPDIFVKPPRGTFRFQMSGDVPALAEIADAEPLAVLDQAGIKADGLTGTATVAGQIDILFEKQIKMSSIDYKIDATLDRFSSPHPIQGRKFQDAKFRIVADPRGTKVTGRAQIDGVVAEVDMYEAHGGSKTSDKRDFKMVLDDAARQRIGLDLGDMVHGAIALTVNQSPQSENRRRVEVDLTPARLVLSHFGWSKGAGVPAKASLDLIEDDKGVKLENLSIESEGLAIAGSVGLDKDHRLVSADFSRFALRKGDVAKIKVTRSADQTLNISYDGQNFDLRGLMQANRKPAGEEEAPAASAKPTDMVLKLRAARLVGFNDVVLTDVTVDGRYRGGAFSTLQASARSTGGRSISAAIKAEGARRRLTVSADDAGAFLSFLDAFDRIKGGRLTMTARLGGVGVAQGGARLDDFHLLEEPKAGRAAPQQTANGTQQIQVRRVEINPQTDFSRSSVQFSMRDGVITVTQGVAKGNSVGATASGQIDLNNQRIALTGTYIPAYGLNNLAGRIPVFGAITGAGSNEGLVGVTFRVFGAVTDPILEINPLSAIAPGIFRRIFEFQNDDERAPAPASNAPTRITP